jgi:hypothetical protein
MPSVNIFSALRNFGNEWSCLEMLDEKLKCLKDARNIAELNNFILVMTSQSSSLEKLSHPRASDSLVHWGDLLAYRQTFHNLISEEKRGDSMSHLLEIKRKLLNAAFAQNNCDAAKFMINDLKDDVRASRSNEKLIKCNLAIGRYNLMAAEQKLTSTQEKMDKLCKGLNKLVNGVLVKDYSVDFLDVKIDSFC